MLPQPGQWRPVAAWMGQGGRGAMAGWVARVMRSAREAETRVVAMMSRGMESRGGGVGEFTRVRRVVECAWQSERKPVAWFS